jgi:uncharacterized membrane protein
VRLDQIEEDPVPRPTGTPLVARIVAALLAALVPVFLLLKQVSADGIDLKGWDTYQRVDVIVLVFAVLAVVTLAASYTADTPALPAAASGLAFAMFGMVMVLPLEQLAASNDSSLKIGGILAILSSFASGMASLVAVASDRARPGLR